jgi:hypothetical protein
MQTIGAKARQAGTSVVALHAKGGFGKVMSGRVGICLQML